MNVLVTGATGFIGACVLDQLVARGDTVRVLVRPETLAQPTRLEHLTQRDGVEVVVGSLAEVDVLSRAAHGVGVVYHLAGRLPGVGVRPQDLIRVNVSGTENLLRASASEGVVRFVFISSVSVYGFGVSQVREDAPLEAHGLYGRTKIDAENSITRYHRKHGLDYVILRPSPIYGPGAAYFEGLLSRILSYPWFARAYGGETVLQWVHVRDLADAVVLAGTQSGAAGNVFNIAGNEAITRRDLSAMMQEIAGGSSWENFFPILPHARRRCPLNYDISKARILLGYTPQVALREGLAEMVAAINQQTMRVHRSGLLHGRLGWARRWR